MKTVRAGRALFWVMLFLGTVLLIAVPGCQRPGTVAHKTPPAATPIPINGGSLIFGMPADAVSLDPATALDDSSAWVITQVFETLVRLEDSQAAPLPLLAQSWQASADGRGWIFKLRPGVVFHDGTPLDARAVRISFERQAQLNHIYHGRAFGDYSAWRATWGGFPGVITSVRELGLLEVEFKLSRPCPSFLANLAQYPFSIVSPRSLEQRKKNPDAPLSGTGPFRLVEWRKRDRIILEANRRHWNRGPRLNRVVMVPAPSAVTRILQLQKGHLDMMVGIIPADIDALKADPDLLVLERPGLNLAYLAMNHMRGPLNSLKVRQALNLAVDRQFILRNIYRNHADPALSVLPKMVPGAIIPRVNYPYDTSRARQLLMEAGLRDGFKVRLWYPTQASQNLPEPEVVAEAIREDLRKVGIRVELVGRDLPRFLEGTGRGEHELALMGWTSASPESDLLFALLDRVNAVRGGTNRCFARDGPLHAMLMKGRESSAADARNRAYAQAQERVAVTAPWIALAHPHQLLACNRRLHGVILGLDGRVNLAGVYWTKE